MAIYRGVAKVLHIDTDKVLIDIGDGKTIKLEPRQFPKFLKVDDLVQHSEHGFYDVVDENGNYVNRR